MYYPIILPINHTDNYVVVPEIVKQFTVFSVSVAVVGAMMLITTLILEFCFDREPNKLYRIGLFFTLTGLMLSLMALCIILVTGERITP